MKQQGQKGACRRPSLAPDHQKPKQQQSRRMEPQGKGFGFIGKPVADDTILGSGIGYGLRKGDEATKKQLDAAIDKVRADGTITRIK